MIVIAVIAIAIIGVGAYFAFAQQNPDPEPTGITIVDGTGQVITIDEPIDSCVIVNTNLPKAMKILGLEDNVSNIIFYKTSKYQEYHDMGFTSIDKDAPLATGLTNAEYFITKNVKYIIEPTESDKLTPAAEEACKTAGIAVIKLDCYGDTLVEDMEKLCILFGSTKKVTTAYEGYLNIRNSVIDKVMSNVDIDPNDLFLYYFAGLKAFYNQDAELSKLFERIWGHNAIAEVLETPSGISIKATETGIKESLTDLDASKPITLLMIRGAAGDDETKLAAKWIAPIKEYDLSYLVDSNIYCVESEISSGVLDYIAIAAFAYITGVYTGFDIDDLVDDFYQKYGFKPHCDAYVWHFNVDADGEINSVEPVVFD